MINTPDSTQKYSAPPLHPAMQFLIYAAIIIGAITVGSILGAGVAIACFGLKIMGAIADLNTNAPHFIAALWIIQLLGTTLPILAAPITFNLLVSKNKTEYLKIGFKFPPVLLLLATGIALAAFPMVELLSNLNHMIRVPRALHFLTDNAKSLEAVTDAFMQMDNIGQLFINLICIALITAIVEELMFRGVMQTIFFKWTKNKHAAVWITAILFSAFHMEFFGFLPRVMLGAILGYFVAYSGSIWPAVLGHFLNNGVDVVLNYLSQHKLIGINADDEHVFNSAGYIISIAIILFLFYVYRKAATKTPETLNGEELG